MPKVFISSFSNVNYDFLSEFGNVQQPPITVGYVDLSDLQSFYKKIKPILDRTSSEDFLALSGPAAIGVVITQFWLQKHGVIRLLSFNKKKGNLGGYQEVIIPNTSLIPPNEKETDDS